MPTIDPRSSFIRFLLTPAEEKDARTLSEAQIAWIRTIIAETQEKKLALRFDPSQAMQFVQEDAHITGYIAALTDLLNDGVQNV